MSHGTLVENVLFLLPEQFYALTYPFYSSQVAFPTLNESAPHAVSHCSMWFGYTDSLHMFFLKAMIILSTFYSPMCPDDYKLRVDGKLVAKIGMTFTCCTFIENIITIGLLFRPSSMNHLASIPKPTRIIFVAFSN